MPPSIVPHDTLEVGHQLIGQQGTWSGSPTYVRQWFRGATPIPGATGVAYNLVDADLGAMIGMTVRAINAGGSERSPKPSRSGPSCPRPNLAGDASFEQARRSKAVKRTGEWQRDPP